MVAAGRLPQNIGDRCETHRPMIRQKVIQPIQHHRDRTSGKLVLKKSAVTPVRTVYRLAPN